MKVQFYFNGRKYIAPSKAEAYDFLNYWREMGRARRLVIGWKIEMVERAPSYVPIPVDMENKIEYA